VTAVNQPLLPLLQMQQFFRRRRRSDERR